MARSLLRAVDVADRGDASVLAPLHEKERELDGVIERARTGAVKRLEAARGEAQALREQARRSLLAEIDVLRSARALEIEQASAARRAEAVHKVAALREAARPRREAALALIVSRVIGVGP